ncbi:hypothetical protein OB955_20225 [Halobacteria archaeon AArc-m2/3/4]|uniref:NrS-1 polymerase-like HBD domain-containing protein n=1 Tax=Natronoglomus mannanivorans TaxID=2979990 RepID=A0ABT2QJH7_9EURY|nr:hypothetical protein [Halobacteria archaeon AArc-m2/3/4]
MSNQGDSGIDVEAIPGVLAERVQWLCWRAENRDGKQTKVPVNPATGDFASTTDDRTWTDLEQALECAATDAADGIGFVFTATDPLVGVDLDDCRDPDTGEPLEPAPTIIERLDSFTEVSPSGTGYHVILEGDLPNGRNRHGSIEIYDQARFFTVTADHVAGTPETVESRQDALEDVHEEFVAQDDSDESDGSMDTSSDVSALLKGSGTLDLEDEELLERARNASNGEKFDRLWRGSTTGYESQSEADMALCCLLAFWTGGDATRVDRLFRQSGLIRGKWDDVHYSDGSTYGEKTVERAITNTDDVYDPSSSEETPTREPRDGTTSSGQIVGGTDGARAAYLAEKNQLLSERVADLEATLEGKDDRLEELEKENRVLREKLTACEDHLERLESDGNTASGGGQESIWHRARRFVGEADE